MLDVIIPVYNGEDTIRQALASLVAQNNRNKFIVTVVDDCSTDNTLEVVQKFEPFLNIRVIELTKNGGVGKARQAGLENSDCELVAFMDSDDCYMPFTTTVFLREMRNDFPETLYTDFISEYKGKEVLLNGKSSITWFHGKVYRKDFLDKYGIKVPPFRYNEDTGFSTMVHELSEKKAYIPEITYYWRENMNSITHGSKDFNIRSIPNFVQSVKYAFTHIEGVTNKPIQERNVFYGQLFNFYTYHMEAVYYERDWVPEIEKELIDFFQIFWNEDKIRPAMLLKGMNLFPVKPNRFLSDLTPIQWINKYTNNQYSVVDFKVEEEDED